MGLRCCGNSTLSARTTRRCLRWIRALSHPVPHCSSALQLTCRLPELVMRLREELRAARAAVRVLKLDKVREGSSSSGKLSGKQG